MSKRRRCDPFKTDEDKAEERIERALSQRIYLLDEKAIYKHKEDGKEKQEIEKLKYKVMGTTDEYFVTISEEKQKCSCPDFSRRGKTCKHLFFIFYREFGLKRDLSIEESDYWDIALKHWNKKRAREKELAKLRESVKEKDLLGPKQMPFVGQDCGICLEVMCQEDEIVYCHITCGQNTHKSCFEKWASKNGGSCVYCRSLM